MDSNNSNGSIELPSEIISKIIGHSETPFIKKSLRHSSVSQIFQTVPDVWNSLARTNGMSIEQCHEILKRKSRLITSIKKRQEKVVTFKTKQQDMTQLSVQKNQIIISSDDCSLKVFDFNGVILKTLNGHTGGIWTFDSCGDYLVTGSTDKSARIWDLNSQQTLRILKYHRNTVRTIKSTSNFIITGSRDYTIGVWSSIGDLLHRLEGHSQSVRCLDINDQYLVSGSYDGFCKLWDYKKGKFLKDVHIHENRVYCVKINNNFVASAGVGNLVKITKLDTDECISYNLHSGIVGWMDFQGNYLITSSLEGSVVKYDYVNNVIGFRIILNEPLRGHKITDSLIIIATFKDVKLYSFRTGRFLRTLMSANTIYKIDMIDWKIVVGYQDGTEFKVTVFDYEQDL